MLTYQKRVPLLMLLDSIIVLLSIYVGYFILHPYSDFYSSKLLLMSSLILLLVTMYLRLDTGFIIKHGNTRVSVNYS